MEVGLKELKANLGRYVARARTGEPVIITRRGKPIARIESTDPPEPPPEWKHLVESGRMIYRGRRGKRVLPKPSQWIDIGDGKTLSDILIEMRHERDY